MILNIITFIIFTSLIFSNSIYTLWGKCELHIYDTSFKNDEKIIMIINSTINQMNTTYGKIEQDEFSIYITNTLDEYYKYSGGIAPEWSVGITVSNPDKIVIKSPKESQISLSKFYQIIKHELNHLYINRFNNKHTVPRWFKEGFASITAKEFSVKHKIKLSKAIFSNSLLSAETMNNFKNVDKDNSFLAYSQSYAMINGLQYYYGNEIIIKIIYNLRNGKTFNQSIEYITGDDIDYVNSQIMKYISSQYNWLFLLDVRNIIFPILPLILLTGFLYKKIKNKKIIAAWEEEERELKKLEDEIN